MVEFDDLRLRLLESEKPIENLREALAIDHIEAEVAELEKQAAQPGFWDDAEESQKILKKTGALKSKLESYEALKGDFEDALMMIELANEEGDESMVDDCRSSVEDIEKRIEELTLTTLLSGEYDAKNALLTFHAGAGGTEAMDWAEMLFRMYTRWGERHGYKVSTLDYLDGDEAGLKSASILIEGENAYGFLKGENGVHRLVRVSPFDANARRQTSFSAIEVIPDIEDDSQDVEIRPEDYEMQVFRSSGAGGQHINKTSSAVRLIHKATGIVVSCQTERSQFQNKETCLRMLRSKLVEIKEREHLDKISDIKGVQQKIEWGSQIRNYVFMPYTLVKDTRTGCETSNVNAVMDGALDPFIESYLNCLATGNWVQK